MRTSSFFPGLALVIGLASATGLFAQAPKVELPAASPASTLKQRVGLTDIEIVYSRPGVKGRKVGVDIAPYGEVWRTGANSATRITFSTPVKLNGTDVPAGTYGFYTIPGEKEWTVIMSKKSDQWGAYSYNPQDDLARFKATPVKLSDLVETFTIGFSDVHDESAMLNLSWAKMNVPVKVEVEVVKPVVAQIESTMASADKKAPGFYFQSALFYYDHGQDLKKALSWVDTAIAESPKPSLGHYHLKAKILAKLGDKDGAIAAANQSIKLATESGGPVKDEYTRLNEKLISSLK
ncbi:MAG TPA: DUF2911 domain-containing protein [Opitutaceae bacterium]|nr:DUF2911 domain-containing protein [Opitutaceae bacterium]